MMKNLIMALCLLFSMTNLFAQEHGEASYYGDKYHGRPTANGEKYDKNLLTAAHKTLPFGTLIKVTRKDNGKSVQVRVNDRGPSKPGRIVDLSGKAAEIIDLKRAGLAQVVVEIIEKDGTPPPTPKRKPQNKVKPARQSKIEQQTTPVKPAEKKEVVVKKAKTTSTIQRPKQLLSGLKTGSSYKFQIQSNSDKRYGVQVAAVTDINSMIKLITDYEAQWFEDIFVTVDEKNNQPIYKIILGSFEARTKALSYKNNLKTAKKIDGFVVALK